MTPQDQLQKIRQSLSQLRGGELSINQFSAIAGAQDALLAGLPQRFADVLMQLLTRLESGALFSEESCSFSQTDLLASLDLWLEKASLQLDKNV